MELAALAGLVTWGFQPAHTIWQKILMGIGLPILAAVAWAIFRVPNDSGRAMVAIPGVLRLVLELVVSGRSAFAWYAAGHTTLALVLAAAILLDYAIMLERVRWLLGMG